ncbi:hypothetical protein NP233_g11169 [Leucocoprinus birnbaumii]|uniref:Uncharacterized protein n=1 Tax=Leucocoprinus birnbaumii TaxID=56174 RepID=A0AAD5YR75_9AGAR|nr:hypothetical protein NP233_g11169 [Leucocoprinus birnbaumii]
MPLLTKILLLRSAPWLASRQATDAPKAKSLWAKVVAAGAAALRLMVTGMGMGHGHGHGDNGHGDNGHGMMVTVMAGTVISEITK